MKDLDTSFLADESLKTKLLACPDLPSPPGVAMRILDIGNDPHANLSRIAEVVSLDPALTAKILRIANSAFYARQRKVENLRQAVVMFGLNGTLTLALSFSLVQTQGRKDNAGIDYNAFWRRSLVAASACRQLGKLAGLRNMEDLFLAGLLQDIGVLALEQIMPDLYVGHEALQRDHRALQAYEQSALGADHAAIGAWLLSRWNLSERWVVAVAASHDPELAQDAEHRLLADCVTVSSELADFWWAEDPETVLSRAADRAEQCLNIGREALADVIEVVTQEAEETADMYDISLGDTGLMHSLMAQARELLMVRSLHSQLEAENLTRTTQTLESRARDLEEKTRRDGLTGLYNRAHLDAVLNEEFNIACSQSWPLTLALIDIDHFKKVNDTYGHQAGDEVLRQAAQLFIKSSRDSDIAARYGGEEFVIILPGTDLHGAKVVCDRLLTAFRETPLKITDEKSIDITVSIGLASLDHEARFIDSAAFIHAADGALYEAKSSGRDCVVVYKG